MMQKIVIFAALLLGLAVGLTLHSKIHQQEAHQNILGKFIPPCQAEEIAEDNGVPPDINGCGSGNFQSAVSKFVGPYAHKFTPCCNVHDKCFEVCSYPDFEGTLKRCNDDFGKCMYSICDDLAAQSKSLLRVIVKSACKANAWSFDQAVKKLGSYAYTNSQKRHCRCKAANADNEEAIDGDEE